MNGRRAQASLAAEGRRSPLAAWRLLARAMAAQARSEHDEAARSARQASVLAPHFPLAAALAGLMGTNAPPPTGAAAARQRQRVKARLARQAHPCGDAGGLLLQLRGAKFNAHAWRQSLQEIAEVVCPADVAAAVRSLSV